MHTAYDLLRFIYITKYEFFSFFPGIFFVFSLTRSCSLLFFCSIVTKHMDCEAVCNRIKTNENTIVARSRELIIKDTWNSTESDWSTWFVHCCTLVQQLKIRLSMNKRCNHFKICMWTMKFFVNRKTGMDAVIYL